MEVALQSRGQLNSVPSYLIPSLSPLTDRRLRPTTSDQSIAQTIATEAPYNVSWDRGLHVSQILSDFGSPIDSSRHCFTYGGRPKTASATPSLSYTQVLRPKVPSMLIFNSKAKQSLCTQTAGGARPATAGGFQSPRATVTDRGLRSAGGEPISRLSKSMNFLSSASAAIPSANLSSLATHGGGRPATSCGARPATSCGGRPTTSCGVPLSSTRACAPTAAAPVGSAAQPLGQLMQQQTQQQQQEQTSGAPPTGAQPAHERPGSARRAHTPPLVTAAAPAERPRTAAVTNMTIGKPSGRMTPAVRGGTSLLDSTRPFTRRYQPHPMAQFKPSRAQALMVFNRMDSNKTGKVTMTDMESAIIGLGLSMEKAKEIFAKLDQGGKGYLTTKDWGDLDSYKVVELLCHMYMRQFMGLPDTSSPYEQVKSYFKTQELKTVRTLPAAINLVRLGAVTAGAHAAQPCGDVVYDAFRFIDTDKSGVLSKQELMDGFAALGVNLSDTVTDQVMDVFDRDKSGWVGYDEFVKVLFPKKQ